MGFIVALNNRWGRGTRTYLFVSNTESVQQFGKHTKAFASGWMTQGSAPKARPHQAKTVDAKTNYNYRVG